MPFKPLCYFIRFNPCLQSVVQGMSFYAMDLGRDVVLGLGPWLSSRTKLQSLVLALNFQSLFGNGPFCHNRLVVQWYGPCFTGLVNIGSSLHPTTGVSFQSGLLMRPIEHACPTLC